MFDLTFVKVLGWQEFFVVIVVLSHNKHENKASKEWTKLCHVSMVGKALQSCTDSRRASYEPSFLPQRRLQFEGHISLVCDSCFVPKGLGPIQA